MNNKGCTNCCEKFGDNYNYCPFCGKKLTTRRICKNCENSYIPNNQKSEFCCKNCRNSYNVRKSRSVKKLVESEAKDE